MEIFYQYTIGQINFETLGLLFSLMGVVAGITKLGYIDNFTTFFLNKTGNTSKLALFLTVSYTHLTLPTNSRG